jgi:hypothetical protein
MEVVEVEGMELQEVVEDSMGRMVDKGYQEEELEVVDSM